MDDKLAGFKADVRQAQEDAAAKAVTRAQLEKPYHYKKKAHEEQARFNDQVSACIREAQGSIATSDETPAQKRAQEALEKGAQLLAERQKLIKIAEQKVSSDVPCTKATRNDLFLYTCGCFYTSTPRNTTQYPGAYFLSLSSC